MAHLARIETRSNQDYIFASSRLRHAVGGSHLLAHATTVALGRALGLAAPKALLDPDARLDALAGTDRANVRVVTCLSGLALLVSDDSTALVEVIRAVTSDALVSAPGLALAGAIVPVGEREGGFAKALAASALAVQRVHAERFDASAVLPLAETCPYSARPASTLVTAGTTSEVPVSELVAAQEHEQTEARKRLAEAFAPTSGGDGPSFSIDTLDEAMSARDTDGRWMAVTHIDGNGIGALLRAVGAAVEDESDLDSAIHLYRRASAGLDAALNGALRDTVEQVFPTGHEAVVPIVVGGDDLTFVGWHDTALDVVETYAARFAHRTAQWVHELEGLDVRPTVAGTPSVAAGVAVTKPNHPIQDGLRLAEDLTRSAKTAKTWVGRGEHPPSTVDLHVLMDSTPAALDVLRSRRVGGDRDDRIELAAGPYQIDVSPAPTEDGAARRPPNDERVALTLVELRDLVTRLTGESAVAAGAPSRSSVQHCRVALFEGRAALRAVLDAYGVPDGLTTDDLEVALTSRDGDLRTVSPLIDALELASLGGRA